jgi:hypothetical protein
MNSTLLTYNSTARIYEATASCHGRTMSKVIPRRCYETQRMHARRAQCWADWAIVRLAVSVNLEVEEAFGR